MKTKSFRLFLFLALLLPVAAFATAPVITLLGSGTVTLNRGASYTDAGATAHSGTTDLTSSIVTSSTNTNPNTNVVGKYTITYNVKDAAGVAAPQVTRTVFVEGPIITPAGIPTVAVFLGGTYADAGAVMFDGTNDLTSTMTTVNPVSTSTSGTYMVTYDGSNAAGITALEVKRTVYVVPVAPVITEIDGQPALSGSVTTTRFEVPVGKTLVLPVLALSPNGAALSCTASSDSPSIIPNVRSANPSLQIALSHGADTVNPGDGPRTVPAFSGTMNLMLFRDLVPQTAGLIGGYAQSGSYNGLTFHRISPANDAIQGGDPTATGSGQIGVNHENEFNPALIFIGAGQLAMANAGYDSNFNATNSSQFFITPRFNRSYDFNYTIFGQLLSGWELLSPLINVQTDSNEKPVVPITWNNVSVVPDRTDATLFIAATGTADSTVTVTVSDGVHTPTPVLIHVLGVADTVDDPPIIVPFADQPAEAGAIFQGNITGIDLEGDNLAYGAQPNDANSLTGISSRTLLVSGTPAGYEGPANVAVGVEQSGASSRGSSSQPFDICTFTLGFGAQPLTGYPSVFQAHVAQGITPTVATVLDGDPTTPASEISAEINWGDGSALAAGSVALDPGAPTSNQFLISGSHSYAAPGTYEVIVKVTGRNGAKTKVVSYANITGGDIAVTGRFVTATSGTVASLPVATFTDAAPVAPGSYTATINWGDGKLTSGTVVGNGPGSFQVSGSTTYASAGKFTTFVEVARSGTSAYAWGTVNSTAATQTLPPFAVANLFVPGLSIAHKLRIEGSVRRYYGEGTVQITNSGSRALSGASIAFYLSNDSTLTTGTAANSDTPLVFANGVTTLPLPAIGAGSTITVGMLMPRVSPYASAKVKAAAHARDYRVRLPANGAAKGKFLIGVFHFNDPIEDFQANQTSKRIFGTQLGAATK